MKIAILGFGSVGQGVAEAIRTKNLDLLVTAIADSRSGIIDPEGINIEKALDRKKNTGLCGDTSISSNDIIETADFDVLVEVTPTDAQTGEPALSYIKRVLEKGKHVVTSNKGPIALEYDSLMEIASKHSAILRYEATVCGAIPIIQALEHGLAGNTVRKISGIFNGTCNYILTRMADEGLTYQQALAEARELGYAEADPTYDIKGIDAAIKLVILANAIWGMNKRLDDVDITGIDSVTSEGIALAEEQECTIRLIGEIIPGEGLLRVAPRTIPKNHVLVVQDTLNAVTTDTDMAGEITMIGKGAGSIETASAIISDILFIRDCYVQRS